VSGPAEGEVTTPQFPPAQGVTGVADSVSADVIGILDTLDIPLVVVGLDCTTARFNRAAAEVLGLTPTDIGRHPCNIRALADVKDLEQACARVMADREPSRHDIRKGDRWFLLRIAPYAGSDRQVRGAVLTFTNVTGFRASIGQAIYEREYTKTILNTVIEPLVVLDPALRVQTANRAFYDWFGVSREQAQAVALSELGDRDWKTSGLWSSLKATLDDNREFQTVELECDFPAVGHRTVLLDARRLSRDGNGLLLLGFRDITARKNLERERESMLAEEERLRMDAEAATRAKDRFLAVLSHELRTPLSPVVMTVAAMENNPDLPFALREDLAMIRRNIELETRLIDDLLDLSRITSGKMRLDIQPSHVHVALRQAVENCATETSAKKLNVRLDLRADDDLLNADPARLQQVFWNLLRNAAKFTPEGGDIDVRTETTGDKVRIEVRDTGVGMAPEFLPRVFEAFEQGDIKTNRQFGGLGLGLAVCKAVVDLHGGTIRAHSDGLGKGATFTVELPPAVAPGRASPPAARPLPHEGANGHLRVLLVEDHPDTRNVLARLLRASNHAVQTAGSVEAALQLAAAERFDVVVSDLGLPDGTGYDLMKQISQRYGIKGIALSGYGMEEDQRRSREAGFLEHIVKPVNVGQLEAVIKRIAGSQVSG
jgi:two-component system CheB/CheR fusion protein